MSIYAQSAASAEWSAGQEERLRLATRAAGIGIWEWNLSTGTMLYDQRAREIFGLPPEGIVTIDIIREITHPDDRALVREQSQRALDPSVRSKEQYKYRIRQGETGEIRWVEAHAEAVFDGDGADAKALRYVGTFQDVTKDQLLNRQLVEDEARLKLAMEAGGFAVWEVDTASGAVTQSPELNRMFGFSEGARPTLEDFHSRYAPGELERLTQLGAEAAAAGKTKLQAEIWCIWPDGSTHCMLMNAQAAPGEPEENGRVIGTLMDITDRKRDQERLELLAREMRHRVKNALSIVQALTKQSLKPDMDIAAGRAALESRLQALSGATDLLFADEDDTVALNELAERVLLPFWSEPNPFTLNVAAEEIPSSMVVPSSLILHELATNALKYGALAVPEGRIEVDWTRDDESLHLRWQERLGPIVHEPSKFGFGTRLLKHLSTSLGGNSSSQFRPDGFIFEMQVPVQRS